MTTTITSFTCTVAGSEPFRVRHGQTLLHDMPKGGREPIQVGCRGGGCGVCRVRVLEGEYTTKRMSRRFVSEVDEADGYALACRLLPAGDLTVVWDPLPQG